jgi:septum formation protein
MKWYPDYQYVLGSKSPRRQLLLAELGLPFTVRTSDIDEDFPPGLGMTEIPVYIARKKAESLSSDISGNEMVITADTIVWLEGEVLGKPGDAEHARQILRKLSNRTHQVVTGVCMSTLRKQRTFFTVTDVEFKELSDMEIKHYIETCSPFDKAGAYGIQEWIGLTGIRRIDGSYFNVVGLPVHELYDAIRYYDQ